MGCDIHPFFETRQPDGQWKLTWGSRPSRYWNEEIVDAMLKDGSAETVVGPRPDDISEELDRDSLRFRLERYMEGLSPEEIEEKYSQHPLYNRSFFPKKLCDIGGEWCSVTSRSYYWFAAICRDAMEFRFDHDDEDRALLDRLNAFEARGIPDDCSPEGAADMKRWEGDGHSHSWLLCSEILAEPKCLGYDDPKAGFTAYAHREWIAKHVADPENTRMVFYFDN